MKSQQSGFTLIELIAVIVILGILVATALPKFVDLTSAAKQAAVDGVAGNIGSAMALNYAAALAKQAEITDAPPYIAVTNCKHGEALLSAGLPNNYVIDDAAVTDIGSVVTCTLRFDGLTSNFKAIGAP